MKILIVIFILLYPLAAFSRTIIIECGEGRSFMINSVDTILDKSKTNDYKWTVLENFYLITENKSQILIGITNPKTNINRILFTLPYNKGIIVKAFGYSSFNDEEVTVSLGYCNYSKD